MPTIAAQRLYHQQIEHSTLTTPAEVVAWMGCMQGQDYTGAKWSVGLRLPGSCEAEIEQAIADKTIVRTWAVRGTLQLVAAADVRWMLELLTPQLLVQQIRRYRELELDAPTLIRSNDVIANALRDGQALTRKALFVILQANGISTQGQRGVHMLQHATFHHLVCQSVTVKNDPTFVLLDSVMPMGNPIAREEASVRLAQRYFSTRAPVTLQDFIWWSGLSAGDARIGLEGVKGSLIEETIDGKNYWTVADMPPRTTKSPTAYLMPGFEEYFLSYRDRSAVLDPAHAQKVVPGGNGMFRNTVVIDGRIVGLWNRTLRKGTMQIAIEPFAPLSDAEQEAVVRATPRYSEYLRMPVEVQSWS